MVQGFKFSLMIKNGMFGKFRKRCLFLSWFCFEFESSYLFYFILTASMFSTGYFYFDTISAHPKS